LAKIPLNYLRAGIVWQYRPTTLLQTKITNSFGPLVYEVCKSSGICEGFVYLHSPLLWGPREIPE